jgi:hypothetical protein
MGLEERQLLRTKSWKLARHDYDPAPELSDAVAQAAHRLGLAES